MTYRVYKCDVKNKLGGDYGGGYDDTDIRGITRGYKLVRVEKEYGEITFVYERKNSRFSYYVTVE